MVRFRFFLLSLGVLLVCAFAFAFWNWAGAGVSDVKDVPPGHQEVAWISPATSGEAWERLVAALELLHKDPENGKNGRTLTVNFDKAFLALTADVPEVALYFEETPHAKLWIRWYKLTGENPTSRWIEKLTQRGTPPLAIIGGETSDRALMQTNALQEARTRWQGPAPLFFITTATAERYDPRAFQAGELIYDDWPKLLDVYPKRAFRFCFTNPRMVEAVLDFVNQNPHVCAQRHSSPEVFAAVLGQGSALGGLSILSAAGHLQPFFLSTLAWADDAYSKDLGEIFLRVFSQKTGTKDEVFAQSYNDYIHYSVGDFFQPNPREEMAVGLFLANNPRFREQPQLLVLPTGAQRARRFLRTLCRRAPLEVRNVVVITGDAITFNNIYRDRDIAWNIQDLPVPLVFFSHRNPIDARAGFGKKNADGLGGTTGTQDLLLHRDLVEALVLAAFDRAGLVADADQLLERLHHTRWNKGRVLNNRMQTEVFQTVPFFDADGNRRPGTGEHVIWLRPLFEGNRNLAAAVITVWRMSGTDPQKIWRPVSEPLQVLYDRPSLEGMNVHGED